MPSYKESGIIALGQLIGFVEVDKIDDLHLINAAQNGDFDEVEKLLKENKENKENFELDLDYRDSHGAKALFYAASKGYDKIVEALIANGANLDLAKKSGATPLFEACANNHNDIAKALFKAGADVGCLQEGGWLYGAKLKEELELVGDEMKQLIKEFINPEKIKNRDKELANRRQPNKRQPNKRQPDSKVDSSEAIALSSRDIPGRG